MKKRLLALALCLVMMTSLLPLTAAADILSNEEAEKVFKGLKNGNVYCEEIQFEFHPECSDNATFPDGLVVIESLDSTIATIGSGTCKLRVLEDKEQAELHAEDIYGNAVWHFTINLKANHSWSAWTSNGDGTHFRTCDNGCVDSPQKEPCADNDGDCKCDDCKASMHTWSYEVSRAGDSLTATCGGSGCDIGTVSVTLKADSVTLPDSPFNAKLTFQGDFKEVFHCSEIEYQYEDPTAGWGYVNPDTFTPKPGNYQAGVLISGLPANGGAAARAVGNEDGANQGATVYLYVKYTAVDPKVTAQTGDNRPIEIMMVSAAVFSALAAAAFILDNKRKYSR